MSEIAIIVADIQEVIGTAISLAILFNLPYWGGVLFTVIDSFLLLMTNEYGQRKLEAIFALFVLVMALAFTINLTYVGVDWTDCLKGLFIPTIREETVEPMMSLIGAIITLHTLYLHSSLVLTRQLDRTNPEIVKRAILFFNIESGFSLFVAFLISATILCTFVRWRNYAQEIDLRGAGVILKDAFGKHSQTIWGIGLFASGQASTMAGALSGQYVMQGYLDLKIKPWIRIMITRAIAITPALLTLLFSEIDSFVQTLNIIQMIQVPFVVIPLLRLSSSSEIMGEHRLKIWEAVILIPVFLFILLFNIYGMIRKAMVLKGDLYYYFLVVILLYICLLYTSPSPRDS
eukprot:TRINITY_DN13673_c0_g1_i3.p1 TRINITY_DN13673_c0_g1~~TRINITY_DN13673_c0_g1_i3.p1  ORF type:complete len:346 (-),score=25.93 TRINITY_DN13673_c0_g1_i3:38-1075(-)